MIPLIVNVFAASIFGSNLFSVVFEKFFACQKIIKGQLLEHALKFISIVIN